MSSVDQRVVQMKFDNAQFAAGVASTLKQLDSLNKGLKLQGATKGLTDISAASNKVSLSNIEKGVQSVADKFKNLSVVAISALSTITSQAVIAGQQFVKSITFGPILDGFHEYETTLNSVQTILANTGLKGAAGLKIVNGALNDLNHYSDQTIYNFSEMARNIGTFTAAGVKLDVATSAIKGIANLAAISGSNAQQASTAMYQLSQAISAGKVSLEDWNSVVNAGMGGKVFQNALMETARVHGVAIDKMVKDEGSFRLTLQKGWLTGDILTETLSKFTGDLTAAQLKTMGYNKQQIAGILEMAKTAQDAATKVKTFSQLIDTLKEAVGSGWAQTWQTLFGDFDEAKTLFTDVSNVLGGFIQSSSKARNSVLSDWKALGGRTVIIQTISNAFHALIAVIKPIKDAFREIFPAVTGKQLYDLSVTLEHFTQSLIISGSTANELKRTFAGVFAILGIGWEIIKQVAKTLLGLFGVVTEGSGGILKTTASIGDFLVRMHQAVVEGNGLTRFFETLGKVLAVPIRLIKQIAGYFASLFQGLDSSKATAAVDAVSKKLTPLGALGEFIAKIWGKLFGVLDNVAKSFGKLGDKFSTLFGGFGGQITNALSNLNFQDVLSAFNTGLFAGLVLLFKKFFSSISGKGAGGILDNISDSFDSLTGALSSMQNTLRAATLLQIAAAIGILAISMNVLSKIDAAGLTRASIAISVMFTQLIAALLVFEKFSGFTGMLKMPFVAASLILLAAAIDILSIAVKSLSGLSWNELAKGLTGVTVLIGALVGAMHLMPNPAGMIASSTGLVILAAAIKILASAVEDLSGLSWEELAKGLIGVGVLLGALTLFTKFGEANAGGILQGAGLVLLAAGIKILASAVQDMAGMSWAEIARGLVTLAGSLAIMVGALALIPPTAPLAAAAVLIVSLALGKIGDSLAQLGAMSWGEILKGLTAMLGALALISAALYIIPPTAPLAAASLLIVAVSLGLIADALSQMGAMDWGSIAKAMVVLAGSLLLISAAMIAMTEALPGAAALLVVAAALAILAPVMLVLGSMSWGEILKSLVALAGAFVILGLAGVVLTPLVPTLIGLGIAVTLLGAGLALAGVGVLAFSVGLTALSVAGVAGTAALVAMVSALAGLIPAVMKQIGLGIVAFAKVIATSGPAITNALVAVLNSLIDAINKLSPKIINTLLHLLSELLNAMLKYVPNMVSAGLKLITGVLNGIAANVGKMVTAATNVVVAFINGISNNLGRVIQAGANLVIKFVNGVANSIRANSGAMGAAGANLGSAIVEGMVRGLAGGIGRIASEARSVASAALSAAKSVLGIHSPSKEFQKLGQYVNDGFVKGLDGNKAQIDTAFKTLTSKLWALKKSAKATGAERAKAAKAYNLLTKSYGDEHTALGKLAAQYDQYTAKITAANDALATAIKTRDDYKEQITTQFDDIPTPTEDESVTDFITNLTKQVEDTKTLTNTLQQLRKLGLSDEMYKDLLSQGTASLPFAENLLAGGQAAIDQINGLDKQLDQASAGLGTVASTQLYQAAVDAAQGLVDGLKAQQAAIEKQMDQIAAGMVKAIKKALGIKSPSKVFAEVGSYSGDGLVQGLKDSAGVVGKAAAQLGDGAIDSLKKSLQTASQLAIKEVDLQPSIRPVLDLTDIQKTASKIGDLIKPGTMTLGSSISDATGISAALQIARARADGSDPLVPTTQIAFNQVNNSPKALSSAEIYRQTKNQLSVAKGALGS